MWFTFEKKILNWSCVLLRFWTNLKRNVSQTCPVSVFITNDGSVRSLFNSILSGIRNN